MNRYSEHRSKRRVLVFIVACNAQKTINEVVRRIPRELLVRYDIQVLIVDDASHDSTFLLKVTASAKRQTSVFLFAFSSTQ